MWLRNKTGTWVWKWQYRGRDARQKKAAARAQAKIAALAAAKAAVVRGEQPIKPASVVKHERREKRTIAGVLNSSNLDGIEPWDVGRKKAIAAKVFHSRGYSDAVAGNESFPEYLKAR